MGSPFGKYKQFIERDIFQMKFEGSNWKFFLIL